MREVSKFPTQPIDYEIRAVGMKIQAYRAERKSARASSFEGRDSQDVDELFVVFLFALPKHIHASRWG